MGGGASALAHHANMIMLADAIRLMLFPALMAFAASSDLLTMTISNRVSLILLGGFFPLAAMTEMGAADMISHLSAGCLVLVATFRLFGPGIIGGAAAKPASAAPRRRGVGRLLP